MAPLAPKEPAFGSVAEVAKALEPSASQAVVTMLPLPSSAAPLTSDPSGSPNILEHALSTLTLLREDL